MASNSKTKKSIETKKPYKSESTQKQTSSISGKLAPSGIQKYFTTVPNCVISTDMVQKPHSLTEVSSYARRSSISSSINSSIITVIPKPNLLSYQLSPKTKIFVPVDVLKYVKYIIKKKISISSLQLYTNINEIFQAIYEDKITESDLPNLIYEFLINHNQNNIPKSFYNFMFSPYLWLTNDEQLLLKKRKISNCVVKINNNNFLHQFTLYFIKKKDKKKLLFESDKIYFEKEFSKAFNCELQKRGSIELLMEQYYSKIKKEQSTKIALKQSLVPINKKKNIGPKFFMEKKRKLMEETENSKKGCEKSEIMGAISKESAQSSISDCVQERAGNPKLLNEKEPLKNIDASKQNNRAIVIESIILKDAFKVNIDIGQKDKTQTNILQKVSIPSTSLDTNNTITATGLNLNNQQQMISPINTRISCPKSKALAYLKKYFSNSYIFESDFDNICKLYAEENHWSENCNYYHRKLIQHLSKLNLKMNTSSIDFTMNLTEFRENTNIKLFITNIFEDNLQQKPFVIEHLIDDYYEKIYLKKQWYIGLEIKSSNNTLSEISDKDKENFSVNKSIGQTDNRLSNDINENVLVQKSIYPEENVNLDEILSAPSNALLEEICQSKEIIDSNLCNNSRNLFDGVDLNSTCENNLKKLEKPANELIESNSRNILSDSTDSLIKLLESDGHTKKAEDGILVAKKIMEHALSSHHNHSLDNSEALFLNTQSLPVNISQNIQSEKNMAVTKNLKSINKCNNHVVGEKCMQTNLNVCETRETAECNLINSIDNEILILPVSEIEIFKKRRNQEQYSLQNETDEISLELSKLENDIYPIQSRVHVFVNVSNLSNNNVHSEADLSIPDPLEVSNQQLNASFKSHADKSSQDFNNLYNGIPLAQSTQSNNIEIIRKETKQKEIKEEIFINTICSNDSDEVQCISLTPEQILEISDEEEEDTDFLLNKMGKHNENISESGSLNQLSLNGNNLNTIDPVLIPKNLNKASNLNPPMILENSKPLDSHNVNLKRRRSKKKINKILNENSEFAMQPRHNFNPLNLVSSTKGLIAQETTGPKTSKRIIQRIQNESELHIEDASHIYSETPILDCENINVCNIIEESNSCSKHQIVQKLIISETRLKEYPKDASIEKENVSNCSHDSFQDRISGITINTQMQNFSSESETVSQLLNKDNSYFNYNFSQFDQNYENFINNAESESSVNKNLKSNEQICNRNNFNFGNGGFKRKYSGRDDYNYKENCQPSLKKIKFSSNSTKILNLGSSDTQRFLQLVEIPCTTNTSRFDKSYEIFIKNAEFQNNVNKNLKSNEQISNRNNIKFGEGGIKRKYSERDDYDLNENCQPSLKKIKFSSNSINKLNLGSSYTQRSIKFIEIPYTIPLNPLKFITNLNLVEINLNKDFKSLQYSSKTTFFNHFPNDLMQATISLGSKNYLHITGKNSLKFLLNIKSNLWNDILIILNNIKTFQYKRSCKSSATYLPFEILHYFFETLPKFSQINYRKMDLHEDYIECVRVFNDKSQRNLLDALDSNILQNIEQFKENMRKD